MLWLAMLLTHEHLDLFSVSCLGQAQTVLSHSQARLLKWPALWLARHNLSLLQSRDRKQALNAWACAQHCRTDALLLKYEAIVIHRADSIFFEWDRFHTYMLLLQWETLENKMKPSLKFKL